MSAKELMAKAPRKNHFVAVMHLRRFADADGLLWVHDKRKPTEIRAGVPEAVFFENALYSLKTRGGVKDVSLEAFFATVEAAGNSVITRICDAGRNRRLPKLSHEERETWLRFLIYQWKRTPDFLKTANFEGAWEQVYREAVAQFEADYRPLTPEERESDLMQYSRIRALAHPGAEAAGALRKLGLGIGIPARPNKSFIIGSKPVAKLSRKAKAIIGDPDVEIWLPVARDVITCMVPNGGQELFAELSDREVRALNEITFRESTLVAGPSKQLVKSLAGLP